MLSTAVTTVYSISGRRINEYPMMKSQEHPHTLNKACHIVNLSTTKPQHGLTWDGTQASAVICRPLTAWAMAQARCLLLTLTLSSRGRHALKMSQPCESSDPFSHNGTTTSIILSTKFVKFYAIYENYGSNNGKERSWPREEQSEVWRSKQPCSN